jgi:hypothetical protein
MRNLDAEPPPRRSVRFRPAFGDSTVAPILLFVIGLSILWQLGSASARYATSGTQPATIPMSGWTGYQGTRLEYRDTTVRFSNTAVAGLGYLLASPVLPVPAGAVDGRGQLTLRTEAGRQAVGILAGDGSRWIGQGVLQPRSPGEYDVAAVFTLPPGRYGGVRIVVSNDRTETGPSSGSLNVEALSFGYARSLALTRWVDLVLGAAWD